MTHINRWENQHQHMGEEEGGGTADLWASTAGPGARKPSQIPYTLTRVPLGRKSPSPSTVLGFSG